MSQNPLSNSGALYHNPAGLKPALRSALASLEVQLDQELARYRRTRTGYKTHISQTRIVNPTNFTNIDKTPPREKFEMSLRSSLVKANTVTPNLVEQRTHLPPTTESETHDEPLTPTTASDTKLQQGEQASPLTMSSIQKLQIQGFTPVQKTSIVPAVIEERHKNIVESDEPRHPDDYLESSEALLRSLTEEQKTIIQTSHNNSLLSPLGIGSMLLLLLASLSVGYVAFNPKSLAHFSLGGFFQSNGNLNAENTSTQQAQPLTPIPKYPNLAKSEFPEVKDSNDVVGLKPKAKLLSIASPKPIPHSAHSLPSAEPVQPLPPLIAKTTSSLKPDVEFQLSKDGYYHLVTDNQGDRSLAAARQVVPDAYLSFDGKLIYLGAVKNKEKAKQLLNEIQAKGIKARIAQP